MQTAKGSPSEFPLPKSPYQSAKSWCLFSGTKRVVSSATAANYNGQQRGSVKGSGQEDFPKRFLQQVSKSGALHGGQQVRPTQRTRVSAVTQERHSESPHQVLQSTSLAIPPISLPLPWPWYRVFAVIVYFKTVECLLHAQAWQRDTSFVYMNIGNRRWILRRSKRWSSLWCSYKPGVSDVARLILQGSCLWYIFSTGCGLPVVQLSVWYEILRILSKHKLQTGRIISNLETWLKK